MKKHLIRIFAALLALTLLMPAAACSDAFTVAGMYRLESVNGMEPDRFFNREDGADPGMLFALYGLPESYAISTRPADAFTLMLAGSGAASLTAFTAVQNGTWERDENRLTVTFESGELMFLDYVESPRMLVYYIGGYSIVLRRS